MLIGGQNAPIDAAPEPIRLDQFSVDKAIAGFIQDEEVPNKPDKQKSDSTGVDAENQETKDHKSVTDNSHNGQRSPENEDVCPEEESNQYMEIVQM